MNNLDLLQAIVLKCETELANPKGEVLAGTLADEILVLIEKETAAQAARLQRGLARLKRRRPLIILDLETTSAQIDQARIIEIAAVKVYPDGRQERFETLINPGFDISEEITKITSITNDDLASAPPFSSQASALFEFLAESDVCGYNLRSFDSPILWEEFYAVGLAWEIKQDEILDVMEIFFKMEPRTLTGAVAFYTGLDHSNAHRALPDVMATLGVLDAQMEKYEALPDDIQDLIQETRRDNRLDMAGKIILNADGVPCFGFGKHGPEGGKVPAPCHSQRGYLKWMIESGTFPGNTKLIVQELLDKGK